MGNIYKLWGYLVSMCFNYNLMDYYTYIVISWVLVQEYVYIHKVFVQHIQAGDADTS